MASVQHLNLINENVTAAQSTKSRSLQPGDMDFVGVLVVSNYTSGTFTCKIQHSADGSNWQDLVTFAAANADGFEYIQQSAFAVTNVLSNVRADIAGAGLDADIRIALYHDKRR